tara:strand:+ start:1249 stop:1731 length:483 start_codon:yes stop_codon:yes gene_type:complete
MSSNIPKVLFVFALVYIALYALSLFTPLQDWNLTGLDKLDYTLFLLPFPGFFFIYMLIPWMREELGFGDVFVYIFPIVFAAGSFFAFYVAIFYFFGNQALLSGVDISAFNIDYFDQFIKSSFIYFVLAGVGGWGARVLIENFDEESANTKPVVSSTQTTE